VEEEVLVEARSALGDDLHEQGDERDDPDRDARPERDAEGPLADAQRRHS
jgi:hypothetical protein